MTGPKPPTAKEALSSYLKEWAAKDKSLSSYIGKESDDVRRQTVSTNRATGTADTVT